MVTTHQDMDQHSLDIRRDDKHIGYIQWHPNSRGPRIVLSEAFAELTLSELQTVIDAYRHHRFRDKPDQTTPVLVLS